MARLAPGDDDATRALYEAFFAKYQDTDALRDNHERFMRELQARPAKN